MLQLSHTWLSPPRLKKILAFSSMAVYQYLPWGLPWTNMTRGMWNPKKRILKKFASEKVPCRPERATASTPNPWFNSTNLYWISLAGWMLSKGCGGTGKTESFFHVYVSGSCQVLNKLQQWEGKHEKSLISDRRRDAVLFIAVRDNGPKESKTSQAYH